MKVEGARGSSKPYQDPPLGVEVVWEFQEFQGLHKIISKDENALRKSTQLEDERCACVLMFFFCTHIVHV